MTMNLAAKFMLVRWDEIGERTKWLVDLIMIETGRPATKQQELFVLFRSSFLYFWVNSLDSYSNIGLRLPSTAASPFRWTSFSSK